jgi:CRP/FNR family transcriptional regulator, cyclic AMP receptor protein
MMAANFRFLHHYSLFSGLDEAQIQTLTQVCREECFMADSILFEEGQPADELFVLVDGAVEEVFTVDQAKLSLLRPVAVGDMIGCPALAPPYKHSCTARSLSQIEVLAIDAPALRALFAQDCQIARVIQQNVIHSLLKRMESLRLAAIKLA